MKNIIVTFSVLLILGSNLFSQNSIDEIIAEIEKNNTLLNALQSSKEAEKIGNNTGKFLQNPEIEFHYLWGNPSGLGTRLDFSVTQGFDFPTAYKYRNDIADLKDYQLEIEYIRQLKDLHQQVRHTCIEMIYYNSMKSELKSRFEHASEIARSTKAKYESGESNIIEFNKSQLVVISVKNRLALVDVEIEKLVAKLKSLNGGEPVEFKVQNYPDYKLPVDFDNWFTKAETSYPVLNWIKQEIEIGKVSEKYSRAMTLPKLQAGYMSEALIGDQFQGVIVGMSIPLWENKNTVKLERNNVLAFQDLQLNEKVVYYNKLKALYNSAVSLSINIESFKKELMNLNNGELLKRALEHGEISLIEYIYEFSIYYDSIDSLMEMELELNITLAELNQYL